MKRAHVLTFAEDLPTAALTSLEGDGPAAWLIDVAGGRVSAANAAGAALLALDSGAPAPPLDASMPALATLRVLARADDRKDTAPQRLVFWTRAGALCLCCRVEVLGTWPQSLALVAALAGRASPPAATPSDRSAEDDGAKLKEIARRIREGQMTRLRTERPHLPAFSSDDAAGTAIGVPAPDMPFSLRARLAHELKTPVSAIAAAAEIMKDERLGPLGTRYAGYAADIHGSAQHMLGVIDRMLAESAAEAPDGVADGLEAAEIDIGQVLEAMASQLAPLAARAGIALGLELAARLPHVIADATSIRQIVFNLVTNALKFTERGGRITISARYGGDGPLSLVVADTGVGMARDQIAWVLRGGRGALPQRTTGSDGLGLGLPLVRALAAANGAAFSIESTPGKGTAASVVFEKSRVVPI